MRLRRSPSLLLCAFVASPILAESTDQPVLQPHVARVQTRLYGGDCIVAMRPRKAEEALRENSRAFFGKYGDLIMGECLNRFDIAARFGGDNYAYTLAEAFFRRELLKGGARDFRLAPTLGHREPTPLVQSLKPKNEAMVAKVEQARVASLASYFLSRYGECVTRYSTKEVYALLASEEDFPAEANAVNALRPALAACVAAGQTLNFNVVSLRGALALNYVRLAFASQRGTPHA